MGVEQNKPKAPPDIVELLREPVVLRDAKGQAWGVTSIYYPRRAFIPDVHVVFDRPAIDDWLADDPEIQRQVMALLAAKGYDGKTFGRAKSGMQQRDTVVYEPTRDFYTFAKSLGFVDLDKVALTRSRAPRGAGPER